MSRFKLLSILVGALTALAISATPAFAEFTSKSNPAQSMGKVKVLNSGEFKDGPNLSVKCPASEIKAIYRIQQKHQIKEQQASLTTGPHLEIQVKEWGPNCKATVSGTEIGATISGGTEGCRLVLEQRQAVNGQNPGSAAGGVLSQCTIATVNNVCELVVARGMETGLETGQGINVGLTKIELANNGNNGKALVNINGGGKSQSGEGKIWVQQVPGHTLCPVNNNFSGELLNFEAEAENLNA